MHEERGGFDKPPQQQDMKGRRGGSRDSSGGGLRGGEGRGQGAGASAGSDPGGAEYPSSSTAGGSTAGSPQRAGEGRAAAGLNRQSSTHPGPGGRLWEGGGEASSAAAGGPGRPVRSGGSQQQQQGRGGAPSGGSKAAGGAGEEREGPPGRRVGSLMRRLIEEEGWQFVVQGHRCDVSDGTALHALHAQHASLYERRPCASPLYCGRRRMPLAELVPCKHVPPSLLSLSLVLSLQSGRRRRCAGLPEAAGALPRWAACTLCTLPAALGISLARCGSSLLCSCGGKLECPCSAWPSPSWALPATLLLVAQLAARASPLPAVPAVFQAALPSPPGLRCSCSGLKCIAYCVPGGLASKNLAHAMAKFTTSGEPAKPASAAAGCCMPVAGCSHVAPWPCRKL